MEFSGKELIQGEPDASSFPSGGLRATFEARGYTAWDTTSPAFLKEDKTGVTLYIPTAFISYTGEALDKKVPLLRSMEALEKQVMRVLKALGNTTSKAARSNLGVEQEYFLIDKELQNKRSDILLTGRTVFGRMPSKGQEMDDHYFGAIKERVVDFMREINYELWKLGISANTQHNEVAPNQFELATIYETTNISLDHNQLVMETLKTVAKRHNLIALLHEKPFAGVNGSGKHNNWSIVTDDGLNLFSPGDNPLENAQFLIFLSAVIKGIDKYAPLVRLSASNAGNDHRLGANEAPPTIISIFLGEQLENVLKTLANGTGENIAKKEKIEIGVTALPKFPKDMTDRNRTSPFAFTGNKFEFRMVGSSQSVGKPNVIINTIIADVLSEFADILEAAEDKNGAINKIVVDTYRKHNRVLYNGNGYSEEWVKEAEKRGLPNMASSVDAFPELIKDYSVNLFMRQGIYTKLELESRTKISLEKYSKNINIEAGIMLEMARRDIFPAASEYAGKIASSVYAIKNSGIKTDMGEQEKLVISVSENINNLLKSVSLLEKELVNVHEKEGDELSKAQTFKNKVIPAMETLRGYGDNLEKLVDNKMWPFPTYEDLLYRM